MKAVSILPRQVPASTQAAIDAWLAKNGGSGRRFEATASTDIDSLRRYVERHGYEIGFAQRRPKPFLIRRSGKPGKPSAVDRAGLFAFVDELRAKDGLPSIRPQVFP